MTENILQVEYIGGGELLHTLTALHTLLLTSCFYIYLAFLHFAWTCENGSVFSHTVYAQLSLFLTCVLNKAWTNPDVCHLWFLLDWESIYPEVGAKNGLQTGTLKTIIILSSFGAET